MIKKHYKSVFISDCHLGFKRNSANELAKFLKNMTCDNLYLVGDVIDFWELRRKLVWSQDDTEVVRQILRKKNNGCSVFYIVGNHDGALRKYLDNITFEGIKFCNEIVHNGVEGKTYLVVHGDLFDNAAPIWNIMSRIGGRAYSFSLLLNDWINRARCLVGLPPWSLSAFLKENMKSSVGSNHYIRQFEKHMVQYCHNKYSGAICGHTHSAEIKYINELFIGNCGDWVESCTALVEHIDGSFEIISVHKQIQHEVPASSR